MLGNIYYSLGLTGTLVVSAVALSMFKNVCRYGTKKYFQRVLNKYNTIPVVTNPERASTLYLDVGIFNYVRPMQVRPYIDQEVQKSFLKQYKNCNPNWDINIIVQTNGGQLSSAEAICSYILNHEGDGKIVCYIPQFSHSGGCMIALTCDEIVMTRNSILSPCDAQQGVGLFGTHSTRSIINAVEFKKEKDEKCAEAWLATETDAQLCVQRQRAFVDKLIEHGIYTKEAGDRIYEEFFSGKYNHDQTFTAEEAQKLGLKITIMDEMPPFVDNIVSYYE